MKTPKHTKGPWKVEQHYKLEIWSHNTHVATINEDHSCQEPSSRLDDERPMDAANAKLIAAAPLLLGLLNAMNKQMHDAELAGHFKHQLVANVDKLLTSLGAGYKTDGGTK